MNEAVGAMTAAPPAFLRLAEIKTGGKQGIAAALSAIEQSARGKETVELLDEAYANPVGSVIGITGPPGAGKSTLINALLAAWRKNGATVAVLAVDPSSSVTHGALLGDRVRLRLDPDDHGVFVRSIAARGRLGGLADMAYPAAILLRALFDKVIVESVGVGQSETDIANIADTVVLCIQPGSGDSLQFMKAGIAEIPDIAVVTKADMGAAATRALADLKGALSLGYRQGEVFEPVCLTVSASKASGIAELTAAIAGHQSWLAENGRLDARRRWQTRAWLHEEIMTNFGREGLKAVTQTGLRQAGERPFALARDALAKLSVVYHSG